MDLGHRSRITPNSSITHKKPRNNNLGVYFFFRRLPASLQPTWKGNLAGKPMISVSIVISDWPTLVPMASRCLLEVLFAISHLTGIFKQC